MHSPTSGNGSIGGRRAAEPIDVSTFGEVLDAERAEIRRRRAVWGVVEPGADGDGAAPRTGPEPPTRNLVGLSFSGGGIRSATFSLGLMQGMSRLGVLKLFDYVSTVSGGGYAGGWWSAWLSRSGRGPREVFPPPERVEPERWPAYVAATGGQDAARPDASLSASRNDPIHHLRLFSNYLTPRKGLLSADTWRGATVVGRNLLLTWLVLLPLVLAAVVAGQIYFTFGVHPERNFLRDFPVAEVAAPVAGARAAPPAEAVADGEALARQREIAQAQAEVSARQERLAAIRERAVVASWPLMVLAIWAAMLTFIWVVHGSGSGLVLFLATVGGASAALFIGWTLYGALDQTPGGWPLPAGWTYVLLSGAFILVVACRALPTYVFVPERVRAESDAIPAALLRNRVVRALTGVLVAMVLVSSVFLVAGFSHDLVWFLFDPASGGPIPSWVKQTGGWTAALATVGAMLFTGFMGAPAGGGGTGGLRPGAVSRFLFAVTPLLSIVLLAVASATVGRTLLQRLGNIETDLHRTDTALLVAIGLFLAFAAFEAVDAHGTASRRRKAIAPVLALAAGALFFVAGPDPDGLTLGQVLLWVTVAASLLLVRWSGILRLGAARARTGDAEGPEGSPEDASGARHRLLVSALVVLAIAGGAAFLLIGSGLAGTPHFEDRGQDWGELPFTGDSGSFSLLLIAVCLACGVFAAAEQWFAPSDRPRAVSLVTVTLVALGVRAVSPFLPLEAYAVSYSSAAVTVVVLALAWVVGLGWMANPNMLSLHAFYQARLVRAYLGASNPRRRTQEITESAIGDDVPLRDLKNCERGAPYQLVNTTLNLVGGGDLTTAQRSADSFVMTKHYCGSARTGYRPTSQYMDGKLTLGTAVAISGAAASPNMGSQTPSAALSMLLALLNVRLAYWAPTPNLALWRDPRPRLWPFYLLREFLSQTNALSPYCCLSDGGHFDNSGLYPLVARGCRYIVLSDCGADPLPSFEDLGNAIRRCRIDFGAEIDLRIDQFLPTSGPAVRAHFMVGSITYSEAHARALGWPDAANEAERRGVVVWIKPSLTLTRESADLRQYALGNPVFPQQPTADQWYDEAQFESYRRLGEYTAHHVFGGLEIPDAPDPAKTQAFFEDLRAPGGTSPKHFRVDVVADAGKNALRIVEAPAPVR